MLDLVVQLGATIQSWYEGLLDVQALGLLFVCLVGLFTAMAWLGYAGYLPCLCSGALPAVAIDCQSQTVD